MGSTALADHGGPRRVPTRAPVVSSSRGRTLGADALLEPVEPRCDHGGRLMVFHIGR